MDLLAVGLLGTLFYIGSDGITDKIFPEKQEQTQVEITQQKDITSEKENQPLMNLSQRYDPLNPDDIFLTPEVESIVKEEQSSVSSSVQVGEHSKGVSKPFTKWFENVKLENKARVDRHAYIRDRGFFDK